MSSVSDVRHGTLSLNLWAIAHFLWPNARKQQTAYDVQSIFCAARNLEAETGEK